MTPPTFEQLCAEFLQFRQIMEQSIAQSPEGATKQQSRELARFLDRTFAELQQVYPKAQAEMNQMLAQAQAIAAKAEADATALTAQLEAADQAAATPDAPTSPAGPPFDLLPGTRLRHELLERFSVYKADRPERSRQIWEDWQDWDKDS